MKKITSICLLTLVVFLSSCTPEQTNTPFPAPKNTQTSVTEDLPVFPAAMESKDDIISYHYTVENADIEAVQRFYKSQMQAARWELLGVGNVSGTDIGKAYALWFVKNQDIASIDIFTKADIIHIMIHLDANP